MDFPGEFNGAAAGASSWGDSSHPDQEPCLRILCSLYSLLSVVPLPVQYFIFFLQFWIFVSPLDLKNFAGALDVLVSSVYKLFSLVVSAIPSLSLTLLFLSHVLGSSLGASQLGDSSASFQWCRLFLFSGIFSAIYFFQCTLPFPFSLPSRLPANSVDTPELSQRSLNQSPHLFA